MADTKLIEKALAKLAESTPPQELEQQAQEAKAIETKVAQDVAPATTETAPAVSEIVPATADQLPELPSRTAIMQGAKSVAVPVVPQITEASLNPVIPAVNWALQPDTTTAVGQFMNAQKQQQPVALAQPQLPAIVAAPPAQKQVQIAATPSREEVQAKVDSIMTPVRRAQADQAAVEQVEQNKQKDVEKENKIEKEINAKIAEIDNRVRFKSLPEIMQTGTFAQKLGAIFAIAMGGISQAYSGAKTNPVIDFMNQMAEQQAQKDKLGADEKEALRKNLLQYGEMELRKLEQKTNDEYRKNQIALQRQQLNAERNAIDAKLRAQLRQQEIDLGKFSGRALTPEQEQTLTMEERRNVVNLPDGRKVLAQSYEDANKFKEASTEIYNALTSLEELQTLGQKGSKFSLKDRARANSLLTKVVGGLRLPYTGPGVLTDNERQILIDTLGNPLAFFSLKSVEMAKLNQVKDDLLANLQNNAKVRGIKEQVTPDKFYNVNGKAMSESQLVKAYRQQMPNLSEQQIKNAIGKTLPEL